MSSILTVSTLNAQIKSILETTFMSVSVEGEISNLTYHNSGHIYFSLKDQNSSIKAVMWKGNATYLKFKLEHGQKVTVHGAINVYEPRGDYQIIASKIEPSGAGSLAVAYEQLKRELQEKGYFDKERKKSLPKFPKTIAIITSVTGAAIEDMKRVASNRWALTKLIVLDTIVQGESSGESIARNIAFANTLDVDIIIVGRGGGSLEDLWGFNERVVAEAIYNSKLPIISAVGHESDVLISDFVADVRASTPSNAMEIALPNSDDQRFFLSELEERFTTVLKNRIVTQENKLNSLKEQYRLNSVLQRVKNAKESINNIRASIEFRVESIFDERGYQIKRLEENITFGLRQKLKSFESQVEMLKAKLLASNPEQKDKDGFAQITKDKKQISLKKIKIDDIINLESTSIVAQAKVIAKKDKL